MAKFYTCGICGYLHPWDWEGDCCDDDVDRFWAFDAPPDAEIMTWEERLKADLWGDHTIEGGPPVGSWKV